MDTLWSRLEAPTSGYRRAFTLLADYLNQRAFFSSAVEFSVEDLLPRAEVEFAVCDRCNNLPAHDLSLQMAVCVVLSRVVAVLRNRLMWCKLFEPRVKVMMKP